MKVAIFYIIDFIVIVAASLSIGSTYAWSVGLVTFIALTYLHEIKEAIQKGAEK